MTIVAALKDGDSILIGADSGGVENPGEIRLYGEDKLEEHPNGMIAWAYSGEGVIGDNFTTWMKQHEWPPSGWQDFLDEATEYLARLNGRRRELMRLSGVKPGESDTTSILMVGYLDNVSFIIELEDNAMTTPYNEFHAIGTAKPHAYIAKSALQGIKFKPGEIIRFHRIMEVSASMARGCELPVYIWRLTPQGIDKHPYPG